MSKDVRRVPESNEEPFNTRRFTWKGKDVTNLDDRQLVRTFEEALTVIKDKEDEIERLKELNDSLKDKILGEEL